VRAGSEALKGVLRGGGFGTRLVVDAFYGATRTAAGLGADSWDLKWDSEAKIKSGGTLTVVDVSDDGSTLVPRSFTDKLAVAGQEVNVALEVYTDGGFSERVQLGHYRVTAVPSSFESVVDVLGSPVVVSSRVSLTLEDRLIGVERKGFRSEQNPPAGATCWGELQRLSGLQVLRNLPDKAVPAGVVYKAQQGGVLNAVEELADALGGVPLVTPAGALSVLPDARGAVVAELSLGDEGTILDLTDAMESEGIYNVVVGNFEDDNRNPIYAVAQVTTGPFAVSSPYGEYTRYYASDFVKNQGAADSAVKSILSQAQKGQSYRVPVQCIVNPLIEDGDVVSVERRIGDPIVGRVVSHSLGSSNLMNLELDVVRELV
jgi:hypothetical protein